MKKSLIYFLFAFLMASCFVTSCSDPYEYNTLGSIAGTVIDVDSGEPIQGALITLSPGGKNTYTGYDGGFDFLDLEAKQYTMTAQKDGYVANRKTVTTLAGDVVTVSLVMQKK